MRNGTFDDPTPIPSRFAIAAELDGRCMGKKPRQKTGDKSKNARLATVLVMYTLRRSPDGTKLLGPLNKRVYASFCS